MRAWNTVIRKACVSGKTFKRVRSSNSNHNSVYSTHKMQKCYTSVNVVKIPPPKMEIPISQSWNRQRFSTTISDKWENHRYSHIPKTKCSLSHRYPYNHGQNNNSTATPATEFDAPDFHHTLTSLQKPLSTNPVIPQQSLYLHHLSRLYK